MHPTRFEPVIDLKTTAALDLTIHGESEPLQLSPYMQSPDPSPWYVARVRRPWSEIRSATTTYELLRRTTLLVDSKCEVQGRPAPDASRSPPRLSSLRYSLRS